ALLERKIVELRKPSPSGRKLQVNVELQADFSLHQALSLYLLDTLPRFEPEAPDFALDVLTLCESIVEDPDLILRRQVDRLKTEELARLKADGVPYEERMNKLDAIEHPKPLREFLYETFNVFREAHPWVEKENVRPKSIAREMYERYMGFSEYVREYGLARAEGVLLRHLAQVYKVLAQTVPDGLKTEAVFEMEHYLRELIYATDSSLVDEWERLRDPDYVPGVVEDKPVRPQTLDWTREPVGFQRRVRAAIFEVLRAVFIADWEMALERLDNEGLEAAELEAAFAPFFEARESFRLDPEGRAAKHSHFEEDRPEGLCHVAQMLVDPEGCNDWEARFTVLLEPSRREDRVALVFEAVEEL
ncbi:MAG: DUF3516 domain-containing protein, partial [Verrucomicrobiota bacterium]